MYRNDEHTYPHHHDRPPPRKQLAYRDSLDSFDGVMIPRRDHSREMYSPSSLNDDPSERHRSRRARSRSRDSSRRKHRYRSPSSGSSSRSSTMSSLEEKERSKARNKTLLAACLATVTTVAAGNNIYRSSRAHAARKKQLEEGEMDVDEARELKKKGTKMDVISLGIAAVCLYNAKNGWKRMEGLQKEERERYGREKGGRR